MEIEAKDTKDMEFFVLTREIMANAQTYMTLADKVQFAKLIVQSCLRKMPVAHEELYQDDAIFVPQIIEEDMAVKNVLLQDMLLGYYFGIDMGEGELSGDELYARYDYYAGGHLLNQIERYKGDKELKNIAFDIAEDWREFKKIVDTMIYNEKQNVNDPLARIAMTLTLLGTPDKLKEAVDSIKSLDLDGIKKLSEKSDAQSAESAE